MCSTRSHVSLVLLLSGLFVLPGCSHPKAEGDDAAPRSEAVDAPPATVVETPGAEAPAGEVDEAPAEDAVVQELTLDPGELQAIAGGAGLEYCLDCKRQASTYNYCQFDKSAFEAAVGTANLGKTVTLRVKMVRKSAETSVPDDPNAPQPDGGFTHVRHDCTVDAVLSD